MLWSHPGCQSTDERIKWFTDSILKTKMMSSSEKRTQRNTLCFLSFGHTQFCIDHKYTTHTHMYLHTYTDISIYMKKTEEVMSLAVFVNMTDMKEFIFVKSSTLFMTICQ